MTGFMRHSWQAFASVYLAEVATRPGQITGRSTKKEAPAGTPRTALLKVKLKKLSCYLDDCIRYVGFGHVLIAFLELCILLVTEIDRARTHWPLSNFARSSSTKMRSDISLTCRGGVAINPVVMRGRLQIGLQVWIYQ